MRRDIGLDVHRDWCDIAIYEEGSVRSAGRISAAPDQLQLFAQVSGADVASRWRRPATR